MSEPQPYDHVEPTAAASVPDGIYRVVGTGDPVTMLRVTDAEGSRANTGEVVTVPRADYGSEFTEAANPDRGLSLGAFLPPVGAWAKAIRYWLPF